MEYREFITESLDKASDIARKNFGQVTSVTKTNDNNQILTKTDLEISSLLIDLIKQNFPEHNIIDEEAGTIDKGSVFTWVIDPIDGTSNFANKSPLYGIMLGLLKNSIPVAGGISLPYFSEIYVAEKGYGAYCNAEKIHVTKEKDLKNTLLAYGIDSNQENSDLTKKECELLSEIILNIRNLRSSNSAFDAVMVAKGGYGACINRNSKVWDNVAQHIIIEEAGGIYTDFFGQDIDYSKALVQPQNNYTLLAASPTIHTKLMGIIKNNFE